MSPSAPGHSSAGLPWPSSAAPGSPSPVTPSRPSWGEAHDHGTRARRDQVLRPDEGAGRRRPRSRPGGDRTARTERGGKDDPAPDDRHRAGPGPGHGDPAGPRPDATRGPYPDPRAPGLPAAGRRFPPRVHGLRVRRLRRDPEGDDRPATPARRGPPGHRADRAGVGQREADPGTLRRHAPPGRVGPGPAGRSRPAGPRRADGRPRPRAAAAVPGDDLPGRRGAHGGHVQSPDRGHHRTVQQDRRDPPREGPVRRHPHRADGPGRGSRVDGHAALARRARGMAHRRWRLPQRRRPAGGRRADPAHTGGRVPAARGRTRAGGHPVMTTADSVSHRVSHRLAPLAGREARRLARHPVLWLVPVVVIVTSALDSATGGRHAGYWYGTVFIGAAFFAPLFVLFAANLVASGAHRGRAEELLTVTPTTDTRRTWAMCLGI